MEEGSAVASVGLCAACRHVRVIRSDRFGRLMQLFLRGIERYVKCAERDTEELMKEMQAPCSHLVRHFRWA